jgi:hypothetical protein
MCVGTAFAIPKLLKTLNPKMPKSLPPKKYSLRLLPTCCARIARSSSSAGMPSVGGWGYNQAFSSKSTSTQWPARRKHGKERSRRRAMGQAVKRHATATGPSEHTPHLKVGGGGTCPWKRQGRGRRPFPPTCQQRTELRSKGQQIPAFYLN